MKPSGMDPILDNPGQQLKRARELKEISTDMVAQRLRLDIKFVHAIDNDDYTPFPAAAYVRGYLRGYARMVDLNADQIITAYDQIAGEAPSLEPYVSQPVPQVGSDDGHIKLVTYSLIAATLLLLGLWWHNQQDNSEQTLDLPTLINPAQENPGASTSEPLAPYDEEQLTESGPETVQSEATPNSVEHEFGVVQFSEFIQPSPSPAALSGDTSRAGENLQTDTSRHDMADPASVSDLPPEDGQDIVLEFSQESWVEITDSNNEKHFSSLGKPGEVVRISGLAPFKVVIGRSTAVTLSFHGETIDLQPLSRGQVARFTLDETGAHR